MKEELMKSRFNKKLLFAGAFLFLLSVAVMAGNVFAADTKPADAAAVAEKADEDKLNHDVVMWKVEGKQLAEDFLNAQAALKQKRDQALAGHISNHAAAAHQLANAIEVFLQTLEQLKNKYEKELKTEAKKALEKQMLQLADQHKQDTAALNKKIETIKAQAKVVNEALVLSEKQALDRNKQTLEAHARKLAQIYEAHGKPSAGK